MSLLCKWYDSSSAGKKNGATVGRHFLLGIEPQPTGHETGVPGSSADAAHAHHAQ